MAVFMRDPILLLGCASGTLRWAALVDGAGSPVQNMVPAAAIRLLSYRGTGMLVCMHEPACPSPVLLIISIGGWLHFAQAERALHRACAKLLSLTSKQANGNEMTRCVLASLRRTVPAEELGGSGEMAAVAVRSVGPMHHLLALFSNGIISLWDIRCMGHLLFTRKRFGLLGVPVGYSSHAHGFADCFVGGACFLITLAV